MKRLFSVFLALCLIFTMIPQVSAQQTTAVVDTEDVTLEGTDSLGTLLTEEILQEQTEAARAQAETWQILTDHLSGVDFYDASLVYKNRIALRFYFLAENIDGLSFQVGDRVYEPISKDGMYYVQIENILPQELNHNVEFTVTDGTDLLQVSYAPLDYIVRMYSKGTDNMKALVRALYSYHLASKVYAA